MRNDSTSNFSIYSYGTSSDVFSINRADGAATFSGALTAVGNVTCYNLFATADNSGWNPGITLTNTNADSSPAFMKLEKISASPAVGDYIGGRRFKPHG